VCWRNCGRGRASPPPAIPLRPDLPRPFGPDRAADGQVSGRETQHGRPEPPRRCDHRVGPNALRRLATTVKSGFWSASVAHPWRPVAAGARRLAAHRRRLLDDSVRGSAGGNDRSRSHRPFAQPMQGWVDARVWIAPRRTSQAASVRPGRPAAEQRRSDSRKRPGCSRPATLLFWIDSKEKVDRSTRGSRQMGTRRRGEARHGAGTATTRARVSRCEAAQPAWRPVIWPATRC